MISTTYRVATTSGITIALHDLGGHGPTLLLSHATGFHGHVWQPMAEQLADRFHCIALDFRGHGDADRPLDGSAHWQGYIDDVAATLDALPDLGIERARFAVGHSMGGSALLVAEATRPGTFDALVVYEPIVHPPEMQEFRRGEASMIAVNARRRRAEFDSFAAAEANYLAKPPLNRFTPDAMHAYVQHGFALTADGRVRLKCDPEHEARTFEANSSIAVWDQLHAVRCPVLVLGGSLTDPGPASAAEPLAERLAHATFHRFEELGHLGPMQDPAFVAQVIVRFLADHVGATDGRGDSPTL